MGILTILGSAFMGSALLLTGYVSAPAAYHASEERGGGEARGGKQREERPSLGVPLYLTVLKSLLLPMMCRVLVGAMHRLLG